MEEYKELAKIYHMDSSSSRDANIAEEYGLRFKAESTFRTNFNTPNGELFITVPRELSTLSERVLRTERKVSNLLRQLPGIAQNAVLRSMVLDEVVCTNAIEDIHSTRRQIKDAMESAQGGRAERKRFRELAMLYLNIVDETDTLPKTPEDIRSIYDLVTAGEIPENKIPDGRIFRKGGVDITANDVRVVHSGLEPESNIIEAIEKMLRMTEDESIPALYSAISSHYLFEYAHPFYDGNGRTGRYLLSLYLSKVLSSPTALSLSRTIAENKDAYYRALKTVENPLNHAELTFFTAAILEMTRSSQFNIINRLENSISALASLDETMKAITESKQARGKELNIIYLLLQYEAFGLFGDTPLSDIASYLGIKAPQTRKYMASLRDKGICKRVNVYSPATFALTQEFKESYGIDTAQAIDEV